MLSSIGQKVKNPYVKIKHALMMGILIRLFLLIFLSNLRLLGETSKKLQQNRSSYP